MNEKYHVAYSVDWHPEGVSKADVPEGHGATDAILVASMIYTEDGGLSVAFVGGDGRTNTDLNAGQRFQVFTFLASELADSFELSPEHREIAREAFESVRDRVLALRGTQGE